MNKCILVVAGFSALAATASAQDVDVNAEKAAIEQLIANWLNVTNQGGEVGADGYVSFLTEDAVFLPPNGARVEGRAGIREQIYALTMAEDFSTDWSATNIDVSADGGQAYAIGRFKFSFTDDAGNPVAEVGKWVDIFEKQADGSWLCSVLMFNSDLPVGGASE